MQPLSMQSCRTRASPAQSTPLGSMRIVNQHLERHHGVITRTEALSLGMSEGQIRSRIRSGAWERIGPQAFRLTGAPVTWLGEARAAALSAQGLISHRAAARVWGFDGFSRATLELTVPTGTSRGSGGSARWHRSTQYDLAAATDHAGVPVTGRARTVLDVAGFVSVPRLHQVVDEVLRRRWLEWPDLYEVLVRHARRGRRGVGNLRGLLDARYGDAEIPDSRWNRMVWQLLCDAGLPEPRLEHVARDSLGRFIGRLDLAYPRQMVGIELDSRRHHLNSTSFGTDRARSNRLVNAGWRLLHFTWEVYVDRPSELVRAVRTALLPRTLRVPGQM